MHNVCRRSPWFYAGIVTLALAIPGVAQEKTKTLIYKKNATADLEMVIHLPPGWKETDKRPAIVFFFGGGWTNGKITQFEPQATELAKKGMVAARADYRVKSRHDVTPEGCVADARSAMRYLKTNAGKLGIDADKIVASGGSAGGHIAACTIIPESPENPGEDLKLSPRPAALILFNPVLRFEGIEKLESRLAKKDAAKQLSPVLHLTKETPPTLILFGTADALMSHGEEFLKKAKAIGQRTEMFTAEGQPHGFFNKEPWRERTLARAEEFLMTLGYLPKK